MCWYAIKKLLSQSFVCRYLQELEQIKHIAAQKEEELSQRHLLERKRLPKILKSDTKTRTMMYRESLRITGGEFSFEEERERMKQVSWFTAMVRFVIHYHYPAVL